MAKGEMFSGRVERIAAGGAGVTRLEGKSIFVGLTAPGDLIRGRVTREHKNWAEAELLEVLESSPQRTAPVCALYGRCGGCSLQHMAYEAQIEAKTAILRDALTRIGGFIPPGIQVHRSAPFGYRNRAQFHVLEEAGPSGKDGGGGIRLGFRERKSSRLVPLADCPVAEGGIRKALQERKIPPPPGRKRFTVYSHPRGNVFLSEGGTERGLVSVLGKSLAIDAAVFFQSNAEMLEPLIGDVLKAAACADRNLPAADVYCGVGTFASFFGGGIEGSPAFPEIDLVEENKAALALARENMPPGKKVNYYALSDTLWAKTQSRAKRAWGFMVLDPPREGLSRPLREYLAAKGPGRIAYVSCDPASLARDSRVLLEGGYELKELCLYDFYPQTAHVESLAVFTREAGREK